MSETRNLAVFDFDNTLIEGDSLWPFLVRAAGRPKALMALAAAVIAFVADYKNVSDYRTFIKDRLLRELLAGKKAADLAAAVNAMRSWPRRKNPVRRALEDFHARGYRILVISGGLDLYLPALLAGFPAHDLVCTQMEIKDGMLTGAMTSGNCVRERKAALLAAWMGAHGPFGDTWGYGNLPHDLPMMKLLKHRVII